MAQAITLTKGNTTWTFTQHGCYKETKSGVTHFPELPLGYPSTDRLIASLEEKHYMRNKTFAPVHEVENKTKLIKKV